MMVVRADAAQLRADVILLLGELHSGWRTFEVARRAMRIVRQNLAWALAYNFFALPLAAVGWIGPWEAALGMGASSCLVAPQRAAADKAKQTMESLYLLIPLSVAVVFLIGRTFWRAREGGQFDDLERPAQEILPDERPESRADHAS